MRIIAYLRLVPSFNERSKRFSAHRVVGQGRLGAANRIVKDRVCYVLLLVLAAVDNFGIHTLIEIASHGAAEHSILSSSESLYTSAAAVTRWRSI